MKLSDMFTFASLVAGITGFAVILKGSVHVAAILIVTSVILDWLDGKVARHFKQESVFGMYLDSLVDICVFGMVPVAGALVLYWDAPVLFAGAFFVGAGAYRLARFQTKKKKSSFEGMPITMNGVLFPVILLFAPPSMYGGIFPVYFVISGVLMVSKFKVGKL